jgi:uncharacterized protein (DUF1501 family)
MSISRRSFVRCASLAAAGHAAGLRPFGAMNALASVNPGYQAMVCIFLYGGNDSNNTLVPFDAAGYANYAQIRAGLAIPRGSLLPLNLAPNYALHPGIPEIQALFNQQKAAFVANVGTLVQPLSKAQYQGGSAPTPSNLFSHPDQQSEWQNAQASTSGQTGWAGRIADIFQSQYNPNGQLPLITSVDGNTLFCNGSTTGAVAVTAGNITGGQCSIGPSYCGGRIATAQALVALPNNVSLVQADNSISSSAYNYMSVLGEALRGMPALQTQFPANNTLGTQLQQIAQIIQARQALEVNRQIFFAGLGNFDTHANQLGTQAGLLSAISPAINAFYQATQEMGLANQITTFTMSDFGRALQPNSNAGTDHAWGGHHVVIGGAVSGGKIYGTFPTLELAGPDDSGLNGRWIPTTSSVQYAATLASWFGVQASDLPAIFPTIGNFSTTNLGFFG